MAVQKIAAAGYCRVSTDEQATSGISLAAQEQRIRDCIEAEGWTLTAFYIDRGVSGRRDSRPELDRLLGALPELDRVVITKLDRLTRDEAYSFTLFKRFGENGVVLKSIDDNTDDSENGLLLRGITTVMNATEARRGSKRTRDALAQNAREGKHHAAYPQGLDADGQPAEPIASIIRRIWQESLAGESQRGIANRLNLDGLRTVQGGPWKQSTIRKVLDCVTYTGRIEAKDGTVTQGKHAALVSVEDFEKVQAMRRANRRDAGGQARGRKPAGRHLFTKGLLRCAHCGEAMTPRTEAGRETYECMTRRQISAKACPQTVVPRAAVDTAVFDFFVSERFDADATRQQLEVKASATHRQRAELLADAKRAEAKAAENLERMRRQTRNGEIDPDEWRDEWKPELDEELAAASAQRQLIEKRTDDAAAEVEALSALADSAGVQGLATVKAQIAGEIAGADGLESVRANLGLLFERFEIARMPAKDERTQVERTLAAMQDSEYAQGTAVPYELRADDAPLEVGSWSVSLHPRIEWDDDFDGYWREILGRVPLSINESATPVSD
jgi:site-specific DNA recombinase